MKKLNPLCVAVLFIGYAGSAYAISPNRILLDDDWKFTQQHSTDFAEPAHDDTAWSNVSLPHDWSVLNDFNRDEPSGNDGGYLPTGKGWYRKVLNISSAMAGKPAYLYLEGAYMNSSVYVNGHKVGGRPYGYSSFRCEVGSELHPGDNVIAIEIDNSKQKNSRWYTGSGIYRHVWLEPHEQIHIRPWSLRITTPKVTPEQSIARIEFEILAPKAKEYQHTVSVPLNLSIGEGCPSVTDTVLIHPGETVKYCNYEITASRPSLWSPGSPTLYTASVSLMLPDGAVETERERFGFRDITYSADSGFCLNGKHMLITGACVHHDNGILGAASYDDAEIRKARLLKGAGFNAVRTSHNPPAPAFLDACDSIGLLVIDEAFDGWKAQKNEYDYNQLIDDWWREDIASLVERDRNHPSVIAWSIGNEIIERKSPDAVKRAADLGNLCRQMDDTRPVTQALAAWDPDWEIYDPLAAKHEIIGYNYMLHKAEGDHNRVPSRVIWQTESYPRDAFKNWEKVHDLPYVIGDFVWTGIDYIGESGIGRYWYEGDPEGEHYHRPLWPWHNSYCGDIDIIGTRKPISFYREILYSQSPRMHLSVREPQGYKGKVKEGLWAVYPTKDSWNWPGHEGLPIDIEITSSYPAVALYQDGKLIGKYPTDRQNEYKAVVTLTYSPGELRAVALDNDRTEVCEQMLVTSGKPYAIRLTPDKSEFSNSPQELIYILAEIVDKKGNPVPNAEIPITFSIDGDAEILATGSGNPKDPQGYFHKKRTTHEGKALAVIKSSISSGTVRFSAKGHGLKPSTVTFRNN